MPQLVKIERIGQSETLGLMTQGIQFDSSKSLCKSIVGARWNPNRKIWTYPLDIRVIEEAEEVSKTFGAKVMVGPRATEWRDAELKRLADVPDPNSMERVDIPKLIEEEPKIWGALSNRPFQTVGAKFISAQRTVILADDPGLGKTLQSIAAVCSEFDDGIFLVIAPKSAAVVTWPSEIRNWTGGKDTVVNLADLASIPVAKRAAYLKEAEDKIDTTAGRVWVVTTPYWLQVNGLKDSRKEFKRDANKQIIKKAKLPLLFDFEWNAVLVDEAHKVVICNTAKRSKHTQTRFGLDELKYAKDHLKVAISGTPFRGKSENMWGTLNWLQPKRYTSYWKWMDRFFESYDDPTGFGSGKVYGDLLDEQAFYDEMKGIFLRRTKAEVASDLPAKMYGGEPLNEDGTGPIAVWLDMLPSQKRQYDQMQKLAETEEGIIANGILSEWTRLKQFASAACHISDEGTVEMTGDSNKLEWLKEFLDDRGVYDNAKNKVIVASQFSRLIDMIERELNKDGVATFKLTGATNAKQRAAMQTSFQSDPDSPKVFLLTTTAGGVSLTLDAADDVVILDETWIPDDQLQVEDRAHRLSRTDHSVTIWNVRSRNSIEEAIARVTSGREDELRSIMDESRGVILRRQIKESM